jgi:RNA polymerase sigma-70 factor (sigma-E family)
MPSAWYVSDPPARGASRRPGLRAAMAGPGEMPRPAGQLSAGPGVCVYVETNQPGEAGPPGVLDRRAGSRDAVTSLYAEHAVGLIRLAVVMIGDRPTAEEIVQDAFCGLYRRWDRISDPGKALEYVRAAVLNGCRSALRRRVRWQARSAALVQLGETTESAESSVLVSEEHRAVLAALRRLPARQREALVLRFYLELGEAEISRSIGVTAGTVKSTTSRALAALGRLLGEAQ